MCARPVFVRRRRSKTKLWPCNVERNRAFELIPAGPANRRGQSASFGALVAYLRHAARFAGACPIKADCIRNDGRSWHILQEYEIQRAPRFCPGLLQQFFGLANAISGLRSGL